MGTLIAGAILGAIPTWYFAWMYYKKSTKSLLSELADLTDQLRETDTIEYFQHLLRSDDWDLDLIDNVRVWTSNAKPTFQIHELDDHRDFDEPWCRGHPDPRCSAYTVQLLIGNAVVQQLLFVSIDGARITVPVPERVTVNEEQCFFWKPESLPFLVGRVIGTCYIYEDIIGVAERCGVEIVNERVLLDAA